MKSERHLLDCLNKISIYILYQVGPLIGFADEAIKETVNSFKKNNCRIIKNKEAIQSDTELIIAITFKLTD
jgi:hypothetical protein